MNTLIIVMILIAAILFIISFFQKDRTADIEQEIEELSANLYQENYQMKKRLKVIEEELLMDGSTLPTSTKKATINEILKNQVIALHKQGLDISQISNQSSLSEQEVTQIINAL